ncbi:MAG: dihydrofolate reductase [Chitinophagaceae bacterium]
MSNDGLYKETLNLNSPLGDRDAIISILVAAGENNVIGRNNKLPWYLPKDLKYFKNVTWAMPILMGRKTFESIGKPLPGRKNIVLSRDINWKQEGVESAQTLKQAIAIAQQADAKEIFVIGGAEIFRSAFPATKRVYLTRLHHEFEGDAYFPALKDEEWQLTKNRFCTPDEKNKYSYSFQVWERKSIQPTLDVTA